MKQAWDSIWINANLATLIADRPGYGLIESGALGVHEDRIIWVGPTADLPEPARQSSVPRRDCAGRLVTPGLVDCHTHLVYAGNRAQEFEMRLKGASYEQIARSGGGINSTVRATRQATADELYLESLPRVEQLMRNGVTTVEIKSGYGLDSETELKMLRVAQRLRQELALNVKATFLGAHALPPEYEGRADEYIDLVCHEMLPRVRESGLADAVDAFCENIAFTPQQVERVFDAASDLGFDIKCHAEQLSNLQGAVLAARYGAISVDHLEYLAEADVPLLARAGTAAVLLPGAFYFLRESKRPPVDALRRHQVPMAVATDSNPGSSPVLSLTLMLNMACTLFALTAEEALAGVTREAAGALGLGEQLGTLEPGKRADLVEWDVRDPAELSYFIGDNPCRTVMYGGRIR